MRLKAWRLLVVVLTAGLAAPALAATPSQAGGSHARSTWRGYMNMPPLTPIVCPVM